MKKNDDFENFKRDQLMLNELIVGFMKDVESALTLTKECMEDIHIRIADQEHRLLEMGDSMIDTMNKIIAINNNESMVDE